MSSADNLGYGRVLSVIEHLQSEYAEDRYRPAPLLRRLCRMEQLPPSADSATI